MERITAGKKNNILVPLLFILFFLEIIICNLIWTKEYLNTEKEYIGLVSKYLSEDELIDFTNSYLSNNSEISQKQGIEALKAAGYGKSYVDILLNDIRMSVFVVPGVFVTLNITIYVFCRKKNRLFKKSLEKLSEWARGNDTEIENFNNLPYEMVELVYDQKKRLERLTKIHEEDNQRLVNYLEDISHQLKNPLAIIRAICEMLAERKLEARDDMNKCIELVDKMNELIRQLLVLGRFECGKVNATFNEISPHDIYEPLMNEYEFFLKNEDLSIKVIDNTNDRWLCDEFWLREAIDNVLTNAMRHCSSGGQIVLEFYSGNEDNSIVIWDDGKGFKEGTENTIFDRYASADRLGKDGFGLGLAITKKIIEMHLGNIIARNHEPKGAEFIITLPRIDEEAIYQKKKNVTLM